MTITRQDDLEMILNERRWPGETLCLKKQPKPGEPVGVMGYAAFGVLTNARLPLTIYLRPSFVKEQKYNSVDDLLDDGWIVD